MTADDDGLDQVVPQALAPMIDPNQDGLEHINIYSRGRTQIGRWLSNFSHSPFTHPHHGWFASMEAYWYWISGGRNSDLDHIRPAFGFSAKAIGSKFERVPMEEVDFKDAITEGFLCKVADGGHYQTLLLFNTLPFRHYLVYEATRPESSAKVVDLSGRHQWQCDRWEQIRSYLRMRYDGQPAASFPSWLQNPVVQDVIERRIVAQFHAD